MSYVSGKDTIVIAGLGLECCEVSAVAALVWSAGLAIDAVMRVASFTGSASMEERFPCSTKLYTCTADCPCIRL